MERALSLFFFYQPLEDLEIDFSQYLGGFITEVSQKDDTVSGSLIEISNALTSGSLCRSFSRSSSSSPMKLQKSMVLMYFILILINQGNILMKYVRSFKSLTRRFHQRGLIHPLGDKKEM
jgi:hypothetical protein